VGLVGSGPDGEPTPARVEVYCDRVHGATIDTTLAPGAVRHVAHVAYARGGCVVTVVDAAVP
jgi:hypothetical protein